MIAPPEMKGMFKELLASLPWQMKVFWLGSVLGSVTVFVLLVVLVIKLIQKL